MSDRSPIHTILLPNVELNMESVTVTEVLVKPGDQVTKGQTLGSVETQKANFEIECTHDGLVQEVLIAVGDEIGEKAPVCTIRLDGDGAQVNEPVASEDEVATPVVPTPEPRDSSASELPQVTKVRASPAARKLASSLGIAIAEVAPSSPHQRIMTKDVEAHQRRREGASAAAASPATCSNDWQKFPATRLALIGQMVTATQSIPTFSLTRQMDVTALCRKEEGLTFTHRLVASIGNALDAHRQLLTSIDADRFRVEEVAVAVAMDTRSGLVAPAIRNPNALSLQEIAASMQMLKARADAGGLKRSDFERAPFALSNLGMFGVDQFQPSVFAGQCAVLGVGRAVDGAAGRRFAWFTLACDHRAVDGAEAARFLQTLQSSILRA